MREISYFYPVTALGFSEIPHFFQIIRFSEIPQSELPHYRQEARSFISKCESLFDVKAIEEEIQEFRDCLNSNRMILPNLFDIVWQNAYLVGSSPRVERAFTYYNKILRDKRHRLTEKTLEKLIFLYFIGSKF